MTPSLVLVLHAHLPFVRHPEHEVFYEENWFFDAITETYVPLLWALEQADREGLSPRLTMSLTPPLLSMLADELLMRRYEAFLANRQALIHKELDRTRDGVNEERNLALFYAERYGRIRDFVFERHGGDLPSAFKSWSERGFLELMTCGATHGFLPLMQEHPGSVEAQITQAVRTHRRILGRHPRGIWLPECGFFPGLDQVLARHDIEFFFVDSHGLVNGDPRPRFDVYAPVVTPAGVAAFARDPLSSSQVWSSEAGYPGHPRYREFYRDLGWDREHTYIRDHILPDGSRVNTGLKYRAITGKTAHKDFYDPHHARIQARDHAQHFVASRAEHARGLGEQFQRSPVITAPFDAELFGHWWFEGPDFLLEVFRAIAEDPSRLQARTAAEVIEDGTPLQELMPSASTWGAGGYHSVWLNPQNQVLIRHYEELHRRMRGLAEQAEGWSGWKQRAVRQAAREVLLALASDWAFLITKDTAGDFARRQVATHIRDFFLIEAMLLQDRFDEGALAAIEERDNLFPDIDARIFLPRYAPT